MLYINFKMFTIKYMDRVDRYRMPDLSYQARYGIIHILVQYEVIEEELPPLNY
jgi:hypothetical protein